MLFLFRLLQGGLVWGLVALLVVGARSSARAQSDRQFNRSSRYEKRINAYFITGNTALTRTPVPPPPSPMDFSTFYVGKNNSQEFRTLTKPLTLTLTLKKGSFIEVGGAEIHGQHYGGVSVFGKHHIAVQGGEARQITLFDAATMTLTGGRLHNVFVRGQEARVDIVGRQLRYEYSGLEDGYDQFKITGNLSDGTAYRNDDMDHYVLYLNVANRTGTPNKKLQQVTFSGLTPTPPEAAFVGMVTYDSAAKTYFVTGDAQLQGNIAGNLVMVGVEKSLDSLPLQTSRPITLTIAENTTTDISSGTAGFSKYAGVNVVGTHHILINRGYLMGVYGFDTSQITMRGGFVEAIESARQCSIILSGGRCREVSIVDGGTLDLQGKDFAYTFHAHDGLGDVFFVTGTLGDGTKYSSSDSLRVRIYTPESQSSKVIRQVTLNGRPWDK